MRNEESMVQEYSRVVHQIGFRNLLGLPDEMKKVLKETKDLEMKLELMREIKKALNR